MLAKLNLDQTKTYELAIAANKISSMIVSFIRGKSHFLGIGSEQGGISKWDDLVIELSTNKFEYIQVKRQYTPFGPGPDLPQRDDYKRGKYTGTPRELSPLDESMKSLGALFTSAGAIDPTVQRKFTVIVPSLLVEIKQGLTANNLNSLCAVEITPSTTLASFQGLASTTQFSNIFTWLKTWCDFTDDAHILHTLRSFRIMQVGSETDIDDRTIETLSICFDQPEKVLKEILSYIQSNTSYTSFITPRPLAGHLQSYLLPGNYNWTQFKQNGFDWEISGTHGKATDEIEYASAVVPALWSKPNPGIVKYHSQGDVVGKLPIALIRLVLHLQPASLAHIGNVSSWHLETKKLIGSTLGVAEDDCETLCIADDASPYTSSSARTLELSRLHDEEATMLSAEMHSKTWSLVCDTVRRKITLAKVEEVRDAIELRWISWQAQLDANPDKQKEICKSMMHPAAEGSDIQAELRIGPKTVSLIAEGFYLLLIISVCFDDSPGDWAALGNQITINVKALRYWSGPAGITRRVRKLGEEGIAALLGKESAKILILSEVGETPDEIMELSLAENDLTAGSIASAHQPTLLITNAGKFGRLLRIGTLIEIRTFLQAAFKKGKEAKSLIS